VTAGSEAGTPRAPGSAAAPPGPAGRVAVAQRQARVTLVLAGAFAVTAAVAAVVPHRTGAWLPLHLFLAGTVLLAISGAAPLFAVTWAAGPPPSGRVAAVQRGLLAAGVALLAASHEFAWPGVLAGLGGVGVIAALVVLAASLRRTMAAAVGRRFDPALHAYLAALTAGVAGSALGVVMATDSAGSALARVRTAHVTLNTLGLVGLVIVGTLPFFAATEARVKMSRRATAGAQTAVLGWLCLALAVTVAGFLGSWPAVAAGGLGAYAVGLGSVAVVLLPPVGTKQLAWAGPRLLQLGAGLVWWTGATVVVAVQATRSDTVFTPAVVGALVIGGYAQILAAALAYLAPVLRGGGHERLTAGFRTTRSWVSLAAANAAAAALAFGSATIATVAITVWVLDTAVRAAVLWRGATS